MADAIVSYAVQRLGDFLIRKAVFLHGVKDEVVTLQNDLRWMQSFLKDAEQKQDKDERIRAWVLDIQDIAYDTEDVIEIFIFKVEGRIRNSKREMLSNFVQNCFGICRKAGLYGIGKEIEALKNRLLKVSDNIERYGLSSIINIGGVQDGTSSGASILRDLRTTTSYEYEEHVVCLDEDTQLLQEKLSPEEPRRSMISIQGMGGLGKSTLARKLYNNNNTKFNLHAWVCVSQEWKTRDLLKRLIKSFKETHTKEELEMLEKMKDYEVEPYLRQILEGRRYLVVIDDVWDKEVWEILRRALPDNKNGSRIIITTRKEAVAELLDQRTYVHKLRFLRPDESWQLFSKKTFPENGGSCLPEMKKLGEEMMAKCGGLPLAIIVLGGILSKKPFHEWYTVKEHIWRELKNDSIHISTLLALSYKDLPHQLKLCFLYLGLFPEDFIINVEKLIQLWVAEEFITQEGGLDLEEVAENCLKELIGRSLIQVVQRNWRTVSTCRVHDLLRDLAVKRAKELHFFHISDETINSAPSTMGSSYRRIAFSSRFKSYMSFDHPHPQRVRTIFFLNNEFLKYHDSNGSGAKMLMTLLYSRFRLLKVLDLEGVLVSGEVSFKLEEAVGKLIHLRYLGLKKTDIAKLPEGIKNLQALQTLDVSQCIHRVMLPRGICKLKQLRHLIDDFHTKKESSSAFEELTNLQTMKTVDVDSYPARRNHLVLNVFAKLHNLKFLAMRIFGNYAVSVQPLLNCKHLISLKIEGGIGNLPKEIPSKPQIPSSKSVWIRT